MVNLLGWLLECGRYMPASPTSRGFNGELTSDLVPNEPFSTFSTNCFLGLVLSPLSRHSHGSSGPWLLSEWSWAGEHRFYSFRAYE